MKYSTPALPNTPSPKINSFLEARFGLPPDNIIKSLAAHYVCAVFYSINALYEALKQISLFSEKNDKTFDGLRLAWLTACGVVPVILALFCCLIYKLLMAGGFLVEMILAYGLASFAWIALASGIFGAICYDGKQFQEGDKMSRSYDTKIQVQH